MKEILLTQNKVVLVDNEDYEWLNKWKWYACKTKNIFYAIRTAYKNNKSRTIRMHREILGLTFKDKLQVDHKNCDGLNNQKHNLRIATKSQNGMNRRVLIEKTSKYKGVSWHKIHQKWRVRININSKSQYLGFFTGEIDAAKAYDNKAKELFGEFANLNFK